MTYTRLSTPLLVMLLALAASGPRAGEGRGAWLGVFTAEVDGGVEVVGVVPDSPAARHGLEPGDLMLRTQHGALGGMPDLERTLDALEPGDRLEIELRRKGRPVVVEVRVGRRHAYPPAVAVPLSDARVGWVLVDLTPELRRYFGAPADAGVLLSGVENGRAAEAAGLEVGDVIVALDRSELRAIADLPRLLRRPRPVDRRLEISIVRGGRSRVVQLALPAGEPAPPLPARSVPRAPAPLPESAEMQLRVLEEIERLEQRLAELRERLERLEQGSSAAAEAPPAGESEPGR